MQTIYSPPAAPAWLPFGGLNLKRNPFGELTRDERVAAAVVAVDQWADWLARPGCRLLQFVGDSGRGKTTHLLALSQLAGACYVACPPSGPMPSIPQAPLLLIDEAERLGRRQRRCLCAAARKIVVGVHRDLARSVARRGVAVRTVRVAATVEPLHIQRTMNRRVELARLNSGPVPQLSLDDGATLIARFGDNIRGMEDYLYDQLQRYAGARHGQVRLVD